MAQDVKVQKANRVLDEEIAALREQLALAKKRRTRQPVANESVNGPAQASAGQASADAVKPDAAPPAQTASPAEQSDGEHNTALALLSARTERLQDIKGWITADPDLLPLIAKVAGDVEGKYLRRNLVLNVVLSTIFLIAGWLLSNIATQATLAHIFGR